MRTTFSDGMMDANSAQMHANTLVFGEPPTVSEAERKAFIPAEHLAPKFDESDPLFRETLLYMRIQLKSDMRMFESVKVMNTVI